MKWTILTTMLLSVIGSVQAQQGTVQRGVQRTFSVGDLSGGNAGRIVASSSYQVSITLPGEIQNVGVNASKQSALVPTVDKSDGRVMYLDVLRAGGFATLNIRLVSQGEPVILKMTVELSQATSGVMTYTITSAGQVKAPDKMTGAPTQLARTAAPPAPVPTASTALQRPPAAARPVAARVAPGQLATARATRVPAAPATATVVTNSTPAPAPGRPVVNKRPAPASPVSPTAVQGRSPSAAASTRVQDGLQVEVSVAPDQTGATRTVTYRIRDIAGDDLSYILTPRVTVRGSAQSAPESARVTPGGYRAITAGGVQGTLTLSTSALADKGAAVVLFEVRPVNTKTQRSLPTRYLGVLVQR